MAWTKDEKESIKSLEEWVDKLDGTLEAMRREHESEIKVLKAEVAILKHFLFAIILAVIGAAIVVALGAKK